MRQPWGLFPLLETYSVADEFGVYPSKGSTLPVRSPKACVKVLTPFRLHRYFLQAHGTAFRLPLHAFLTRHPLFFIKRPVQGAGLKQRFMAVITHDLPIT